jgi:hypothetical protein
MKRLDDALRRLLNAAARAPVEEHNSEPSRALESAVLRRWRSGPVENEWALVLALFRRAVICSALIMILSIGWSWFHAQARTADATELADYAMTLQLPP